MKLDANANQGGGLLLPTRAKVARLLAESAEWRMWMSENPYSARVLLRARSYSKIARKWSKFVPPLPA